MDCLLASQKHAELTANAYRMLDASETDKVPMQVQSLCALLSWRIVCGSLLPVTQQRRDSIRSRCASWGAALQANGWYSCRYHCMDKNRAFQELHVTHEACPMCYLSLFSRILAPCSSASARLRRGCCHEPAHRRWPLASTLTHITIQGPQRPRLGHASETGHKVSEE